MLWQLGAGLALKTAPVFTSNAPPTKTVPLSEVFGGPICWVLSALCGQGVRGHELRLGAPDWREVPARRGAASSRAWIEGGGRDKEWGPGSVVKVAGGGWGHPGPDLRP